MKMSKFTRLVKQTGYCFVADVQGSGMWLGNGHALFRAANLPLMEGREQVRTVLDIPEKAWEKIVLEEESYPGTTDVKGFDLSDCVQDEKQTKKVRVSASLDGKWTSCRRCDDGELVFTAMDCWPRSWTTSRTAITSLTPSAEPEVGNPILRFTMA